MDRYIFGSERGKECVAPLVAESTISPQKRSAHGQKIHFFYAAIFIRTDAVILLLLS